MNARKEQHQHHCCSSIWSSRSSKHPVHTSHVLFSEMQTTIIPFAKVVTVISEEAGPAPLALNACTMMEYLVDRRNWSMM